MASNFDNDMNFVNTMYANANEKPGKRSFFVFLLISSFFVFAIIWAVIGILTLVIGIKDYRHHRKCNHEKEHTHE